jgi:AcrR family transcriptional regulator
VGIAERKEREKNKRRQDIIEAARKVFSKKGFINATIDEIAEEAELSKGTIYTYFTNKDELFVRNMLAGIDDLVKRLSSVAKLSMEPEEKLDLIATTYHEFYREQSDYFRMFMYLFYDEIRGTLPAELVKEINDKATYSLKIVAGVVQEGIEKGIFRPESPWRVANLMWAAFTGLTQLTITKEHLNVPTRNPGEWIKFAFDVIKRGILLKPPVGK